MLSVLLDCLFILHMKLASLPLAFTLLGYLIELINAFVSIPGTDSFVPPNNIKTHSYSYTGGGGNNVVKFQLTYPTSSDIGQVILWAGPVPTQDDKDLQQYQHFNPTLKTYIDLEDINIGNRQIVEVYQGSSSTTLQVYVLNLNRYDALTYTITATEQPSISTNYCPSGNPLLINTIYCSSCSNQDYVGAYCNILNKKAQSGTTYDFQLYGWGDSRGNFRTFTIPGSNSKIYLYFKCSDANINNFIQFKSRDNDVAGLINYAGSGGFNPLRQANTQYTISITSQGSDVSVSFLNYNNNQVNISVWYNVDESSNILLIILAVLGSILFIGLVIVGVCIVKKMNNPSQMVHPRRSNSVSRNMSNENTLSAEQIQSYFPTILAKNVFAEEQSSSMNLNNNNNNNENSVDRDCVICLCPVGPNEMIKVLYCNHIFHAHCLVEWFKKNRNCPYCRQEFSKKSTVDHYQALLKATKKNNLMGVDLASSIILNKQPRSSLLIEQIKD